jgi:hypothetical protein
VQFDPTTRETIARDRLEMLRKDFDALPGSGREGARRRHRRLRVMMGQAGTFLRIVPGLRTAESRPRP